MERSRRRTDRGQTDDRLVAGQLAAALADALCALRSQVVGNDRQLGVAQRAQQPCHQNAGLAAAFVQRIRRAPQRLRSEAQLAQGVDSEGVTAGQRASARLARVVGVGLGP